jgi:O-antigen ligase
MNPDPPLPSASHATLLTTPRGVLALAFALVPWLNPFAPGPSTAIGPYLVSLACAAVLWAALAGETWATRTARATLAAAVWATAATASSLIALCQYFGVAEGFSPWMNVTAPGEAYANLRQRNQFASLTVIGLAAALWWYGRGVGRGVLVPLICLLAVASAASTSRTGLLQLATVIVLQAWWPGDRRAGRLRLCLLAVAVYLAAALVLPRVLEASHGMVVPDLWGRFVTSEGCSSRAVLWSNVVHLISLKPLLGWGWGQLDYAHYLTLYPGMRFCDILDNAHNLPLHLAVELGLPAAAAILGTLAFLVMRARPWTETDPARRLAWTVLAVIGVHSLLEYPLWYGPFEIAAGLCVWLLWPLRTPEHAGATARPAVATARHAAAAIALIATAYAGWDYWRVSQIYRAYESRSAAYREGTLDKIRGSWLFRDQVRFAELTITELTRNNAQWIYDTSQDLLRYSPEPRVIEKLIESATMLGHDADAVLHLARYRAAFARDYQRWRARLVAPPASGATRSPVNGYAGAT